MSPLPTAPAWLFRRSPVQGWFAAAMLFLLALSAQIELAGLVADRPFLLAFPAVMLAAALGGWRVGAAVALASAACEWWLFLRADGSLLPSRHSIVSLLLFLLLSAVAIALVDATLLARMRLQKERSSAAHLLETQSAMLHELQHRVANHMQFISGLLALQARQLTDADGARAALAEAAQRLEIFGRIHRRLYDPAEAGRAFTAVVQELSRDLLTATGAENIVCHVDVVPVRLEPDRLTALAMIIIELLTNALKHAFADGRDATIAITVREREAGRYVLEIRDNGVGILLDGGGAGLGARILGALTDQLDGQLSVHHNGGTVARVDFAALARA